LEWQASFRYRNVAANADDHNNFLNLKQGVNKTTRSDGSAQQLASNQGMS